MAGHRLVASALALTALLLASPAAARDEKKPLPRGTADLHLQLRAGQKFRYTSFYAVQELGKDYVDSHEQEKEVAFEVLRVKENGDYDIVAKLIWVRGVVATRLPGFEGEYDSRDPTLRGDAIPKLLRGYPSYAGLSVEITVSRKGKVTGIRQAKGRRTMSEVYPSWAADYQWYFARLPDKPVRQRSKSKLPFMVNGTVSGLLGEMTQIWTVRSVDAASVAWDLSAKVSKKRRKKKGASEKKIADKDWKPGRTEWYGRTIRRPLLTAVEGQRRVARDDGMLVKSSDKLHLEQITNEGVTPFIVEHRVVRAD